MNTSIRTIHTNLFSDKAFKACDSVLGQLSDGWGENNPRNDRYWRYAHIRRGNDGEVLIDVSLNSWKSGCDYGNAFISMSDDEVKNFFARMIKKTAKMELSDTNTENGWKRGNDKFISCYLGSMNENYGTVITIAEAYCVYEVLLGRDVYKKHSIPVLVAVIGSKRNDEETLAAKKLADAKAEIEQKWDTVRLRLAEEEKAAIEEIRQKFRKAYNEEWEKYKTAMNELKK